MRLLNIARKYKKSIYNNSEDTLLRIDLNSQNLLHNIYQFKSKFPNHQLSAVLKSNAYGHGLKEIASFLDKNKDIKYFVVDSLMEAKIIRDYGIKKPLIILGYILKSKIKKLKKIKKIVLMVNSLEQAVILKNEVDFFLELNLKIDTGMRRQGIMPEEMPEVIKVLSENKNLKIRGMATHLADADNSTSNFVTIVQLKKWRKTLNEYKKLVSEKGIFHFSATAGTHYLKETDSNMIRLGIGLYGFDPIRKNSNSPDFLDLRPVLSFWARIVNIKDLKKGESIGYGFTYKAKRNRKIAILPCGYYEGIPRYLGNKGSVYFKEQPLKILGRISMNMMAVDITDIKEFISLEDEIEIISNNSEHLNSASNYAKIGETIVYDNLCRLSLYIRRRIV